MTILELDDLNVSFPIVVPKNATTRCTFRAYILIYIYIYTQLCVSNVLFVEIAIIKHCGHLLPTHEPFNSMPLTAKTKVRSDMGRISGGTSLGTRDS
jgi:hypothetical protein